MSNPNVVAFPKAKSGRGHKTYADITADIRRAWRKVARAIQAAKEAGLTVEHKFYDEYRLPTITRKL